MSEYAIIPGENSSALQQDYSIVYQARRVTQWTTFVDAMGDPIVCKTENFLGVEEPDGFTQNQLQEIAAAGGTHFADSQSYLDWQNAFLPPETTT